MATTTSPVPSPGSSSPNPTTFTLPPYSTSRATSDRLDRRTLPAGGRDLGPRAAAGPARDPQRSLPAGRRPIPCAFGPAEAANQSLYRYVALETCLRRDGMIGQGA